MRDSFSNIKIYYDEPRLKMSVAGRFLVRSIIYSALEWSFDRALALGGDFNLYVMRKLLQNKDVVGGLARMDVKSDEFISKVEGQLLKFSSQKNTKEVLIRNAEQLMSVAFRHALENKSEAIEAKDLFSALGEITNENISKLFKLFFIDAGNLKTFLIYGSLVRKFPGFPLFPGPLATAAIRKTS